MKKFISLLLSVLILVSFAGCGKKIFHGGVDGDEDESGVYTPSEEEKEGNPWLADEIGHDTAKDMLSRFFPSGLNPNTNTVTEFVYERDENVNGMDCYIFREVQYTEGSTDKKVTKYYYVDKKGSVCDVYKQ